MDQSSGYGDTHEERVRELIETGASIRRTGRPILAALREALMEAPARPYLIHVDGELVFYKKMIGRYPDPDDVLPLIRERIGPEVMRKR